MQQLLIYIFKWALCLAVMYIPFALLMRKETFHAINRAILLLSIVIAAILPFFEIVIPIEVEIPVTGNLATLPQPTASTAAESVRQATANHTPQIILATYLAGAALSLLATIISIARIKRAIKVGTLWHEKREHYTLYCHANSTPPFSWFNKIVISESDYNECGREILTHEEGHIRQRHSWDILFVDTVKALQWFNPFIYMLLNDLRDIHEYEADRYVLSKSGDARTYQLLILKKAIGQGGYPIANNFGRKSVRKRVEMMIRKKSRHRQLLKGAYIPAAAVAATLILAKPQYIYSIVQQDSILQENRTEKIKEETVSNTGPSDTQKAAAPPPAARPEKKAKRVAATKKEEKREENKPPIGIGNHERETTEEKAIIRAEQFAAQVELRNEFFDATAAEDGEIKCSLIVEFSTDKRGEIHDICTTACNVSLDAGAGTPVEQIIQHVREKAIAAATNYILSKEWQEICHTDAGELVNYTANITVRSGKASTTAEGQRDNDTFWIGTTPIR
ncbi:MAG: M56 family metallopeptidase [Bacteroidaceae bacterium]|nr:M56 family metallopeptidase [Bacteroidaceae bacterium]